MPTSKRDLIKRKHDAISNALIRSCGWSEELKNMFQEHHPEYSEGYHQIWLLIAQAHTFINKMREFI